MVSVHTELTLGHLRYSLTDVPPQSNSPSDSVLGTGRTLLSRRGRLLAAQGKLSHSSPPVPPTLPGIRLKRHTEAQRQYTGRTQTRGDCARHTGSWTLQSKGISLLGEPSFPHNRVSRETIRVVVFHRRKGTRRNQPSHVFYTSDVSLQNQTRVKLNRVFFPRCPMQARSPACGFAR